MQFAYKQLDVWQRAVESAVRVINAIECISTDSSIRSVKMRPNLSVFSVHPSAQSPVCCPAFFFRTALLIMLLYLIPCATAADNQLITSVTSIYEYNDNIFLNNDNVVSDNIYTVAPKLVWVRNSELLTFRADGRAEFYRYEENEELDDVDQWYNANLNYRPTERWQVSAQGKVSDDNRPDRDIETTGVVLNNVRRKRSNAGASASYILSETTSVGLYAEFNRENYDDPETSDRKDYTVVLFMNRSLERWLARTTGRLNLRYSHYLFEREYASESTGSFLGLFDVQITDAIADESEVDNVSLTAGTETRLTERLDMTWDLGARHSRSKRIYERELTYSPPVINASQTVAETTYDSYGFVGSFNLGYQGERSRCELLLSHDLEPVSGSSGTANRTTVRTSGSLRLSEKLSANASLGWYWNLGDEDDPTQDDTDSQSWTGRAGLRWELNDYFDLAASYVYTFVDNREAGTTAYRNKLLFQLVASHDWME
jgi:hypothetical protein